MTASRLSTLRVIPLEPDRTQAAGNARAVVRSVVARASPTVPAATSAQTGSSNPAKAATVGPPSSGARGPGGISETHSSTPTGTAAAAATTKRAGRSRAATRRFGRCSRLPMRVAFYGSG